MKKLIVVALLLLLVSPLWADAYLDNLKKETLDGTVIAPDFDQAALDWMENHKADPNRPTVAVVLSGGGARGLAHIGLLEVLERAGVPIDYVVGTSMGALVGALYAAGYSPGDIADLVRENNIMSKFTRPVVSQASIQSPDPWVFDKRNIVTLHFTEDKIADTTGLIDDELLMELFNTILAKIPEPCNFLTDLEIPFACNAADLITGREKVFTSGSLIDAMRCSMSIPIAFTPYEVDGALYIDGGFVNNLGVDIAKYLGADIVIAQNTNDGSVSVTDVSSMSQIVDMMMNMVSAGPLLRQTPAIDLYINPQTAGLSILNYSDPDPIIAMGRNAGLGVLTELVEIARRTSRVKVQDPFRKGSYYSREEIQKDEAIIQEPQEEPKNLNAAFLSMFGSSAIGRKLSSSFFSFFPNIKAGLDLYSFPMDNWGTLIELGINDSIVLSTELSSTEGFKLGGQFSFGSLSPISSLSNSKRYNSLDWGGRFWAAHSISKPFASRFSQDNTSAFKMEGSLNLEVVYLNQPFDIPRTTADLSELVIMPYIGFGAVICDNHPNVFGIHNGYRADSKVILGLSNGKFAYYLGLKGQLSRTIGDKNLIKVDGLAVTSRMSKNLTSYYQDIGALRTGVPGYWSLSLYDDVVLLGLGWRTLASNTYLPICIEIVSRVGFKSGHSAFDDVIIQDRSLAPFSCLKNFVGGLGFQVGTSFALCDVAIGMGFSFDGQLCLYLEAW